MSWQDEMLQLATRNRWTIIGISGFVFTTILLFQVLISTCALQGNKQWQDHIGQQATTHTATLGCDQSGQLLSGICYACLKCINSNNLCHFSGRRRPKARVGELEYGQKAPELGMPGVYQLGGHVPAYRTGVEQASERHQEGLSLSGRAYHSQLQV